MILEGVVTTVGKSKRGKGYYFGIKGHEGLIDSYKHPGFERGDNVKVSVKENERGYLKLVSKPEVLEAAEPASRPRGNSKGGNGGFQKVDWNAAVSRAIEAADVILRHDGFKLGAKTKPEERYTQILGLIDMLTAKFYTEIETHAPLKAKAEVEKELSDDEPEDEVIEDEDVEEDVPW